MLEALQQVRWYSEHLEIHICLYERQRKPKQPVDVYVIRCLQYIYILFHTVGMLAKYNCERRRCTNIKAYRTMQTHRTALLAVEARENVSPARKDTAFISKRSKVRKD